MDSLLWGIDLGGTKIEIALCDPAKPAEALLRRRCDTAAHLGYDQILARISSLVAEAEEISGRRRPTRIGIGTPGAVDPSTGELKNSNTTCLNGRPLRQNLAEILGCEITMANDANCFTLAEALWGAGKGEDLVLGLILGTGVGGAVLLDGHLFTGHRGAAAEPGLIGIDPEGPPCNSGNRGSLESFCSRRGFDRLSSVEPAELCRRADAGDAEALAVWQAYGRLLGLGVSSLLYVFTPERVLIGGGLSAASHHFLPAAQAELEQRVQAESRAGLQLRRAALGNGAGRLGAARLALDRLLNV